MRNLTFQTRLSLWFSLILGGSLFVTGVVFAVAYYVVSLTNQQNFLLRESKEVVEKHLLLTDGGIFFRRNEQDKSLSAYLRDEGVSAFVINEKRELVASYGIYRNLLTEGSIRSSFDPGARFKLQKLYEGRSFIVSTYPLSHGGTTVGWLVMAVDMNLGGQMMVFTLILLAVIFPVSFGISWLMTKIIVRRLFRPLDQILTKMRLVEVGALTEKIRVRGNKHDELVRLTMNFNEMLERLDEGLAKQKVFVSAVSHELKTPLTRLVLSLDLVLAELKSGRRKMAAGVIIEVKQGLKSFGDTIDGLLSLAKVRGGVTQRRKIVVDELTREILMEYKSQAEAGGQTMELKSERGVGFFTTKEQWRMLLTNLLSNALKYGAQREKITVEIGMVKSKGVLKVKNRGEGVLAREKRKIWRRFYRGKEVGGEGLGIGLALVKEVADANGLTVSTGKDETGDFYVSISGFEVAGK